MIDLEKMKKKHEQMQNRGKGGGRGPDVWLKMDENSKTNVRIVPPKDGDPLKDRWIHYDIVKGGCLCPKRNFGEPCPVCDFIREVYNSKSVDDIASIK